MLAMQVNGVMDHGHGAFVIVVVLTTILMFLTGLMLWRTILKNL